MYSSNSNASMKGAPASIRIQSNYGSGTANTISTKQIFATLPVLERSGEGSRLGPARRRRRGRRAPTLPRNEFLVNGTSRWGRARGAMCINGASVLQAPSIIRDVNKSFAQFAESDVSPNKGELGVPVRTALGGGGGKLAKGTILQQNNVPSIFDVSEDIPDQYRRIEKKVVDFVNPNPEAQDTSARVTGMKALILAQIQGNPSTDGYQMVVRNPQMETYTQQVPRDGVRIPNSLATWSSVYDGRNNIRGLPPFQHQVNPIVMNDINADFYSQIY